MSMESKKRNPTIQDFQDLEVKVSNIGRGDLIHEMDTKIAILRGILEEAEEDGWNESIRKRWDIHAAEINMRLTLARTDRAREKGLL
jgi:hypothetical protein